MYTNCRPTVSAAGASERARLASAREDSMVRRLGEGASTVDYTAHRGQSSTFVYSRHRSKYACVGVSANSTALVLFNMKSYM